MTNYQPPDPWRLRQQPTCLKSSKLSAEAAKATDFEWLQPPMHDLIRKDVSADQGLRFSNRKCTGCTTCGFDDPAALFDCHKHFLARMTAHNLIKWLDFMWNHATPFKRSV